MKAKTFNAKSTSEVESGVKECYSDDFKPTLAIVFSSITQDPLAITSILHQKGISVFSSTTSGEFISSEINEGSIAVMLLDINPDYFKIAFFEKGERSFLFTHRA